MAHLSPTVPRDQFRHDSLQSDAVQWIAGMLNRWWHIIGFSARYPALRLASRPSLVMRRLLHVGLDAFKLQRLHGAGLPLNFLFDPVQQFALLYDHAIQLLDLMIEVCKVRFQPVHALGVFVWHP